MAIYKYVDGWSNGKQKLQKWPAMEMIPGKMPHTAGETIYETDCDKLFVLPRSIASSYTALDVLQSTSQYIYHIFLRNSFAFCFRDLQIFERQLSIHSSEHG